MIRNSLLTDGRPFGGLLVCACLTIFFYSATSYADSNLSEHSSIGIADLSVEAPAAKRGEAGVASQSAVLRIEGEISLDGQNHVTMDMVALQALVPHRISTSTVVTDGVLEFDGVLMRDVFEHVGAQGKTVTATALNGYEVKIPMRDFIDFDVVLAWAVDGQRLTVDDKGPFWIVYPRDQHDILQDIRYDYRWVWQLSSLRVH